MAPIGAKLFLYPYEKTTIYSLIINEYKYTCR